MKRRITIEQLMELSEEQKQRLREWWKPQSGDYAIYTRYNNTMCMVLNIINDKYFSLTGFGESNQFWSALNEKEDCLPLLSIEQTIELLSEKGMVGIEQWNGYWKAFYRNSLQTHKGELCDALWQAVKEVL